MNYYSGRLHSVHALEIVKKLHMLFSIHADTRSTKLKQLTLRRKVGMKVTYAPRQILLVLLVHPVVIRVH